MNEKQQELLVKVYENYTKSKAHPLDGKYGDTSVRTLNHMYPYEPILSQEEFIDKIKTDPEFSKKWGLTIEERELSREERIEFYVNTYMHGVGKPAGFEDAKLTTRNVPTKLITVTYTQTIESYEY
jgi:hypothetical protein